MIKKKSIKCITENKKKLNSFLAKKIKENVFNENRR